MFLANITERPVLHSGDVYILFKAVMVPGFKAIFRVTTAVGFNYSSFDAVFPMVPSQLLYKTHHTHLVQMKHSNAS